MAFSKKIRNFKKKWNLKNVHDFQKMFLDVIVFWNTVHKFGKCLVLTEHSIFWENMLSKFINFFGSAQLVWFFTFDAPTWTDTVATSAGRNALCITVDPLFDSWRPQIFLILQCASVSFAIFMGQPNRRPVCAKPQQLDAESVQ